MHFWTEVYNFDQFLLNEKQIFTVKLFDKKNNDNK